MIVDLMYESRHPLHEPLHLQHGRVRRVLRRPQGHQRRSRARAMREILARIQDGELRASDFVADCANGHAWLLEQRREDQRARDREDRREHPLHVQLDKEVGVQAACAKAGSKPRLRAWAAGVRCAVRRGSPGRDAARRPVRRWLACERSARPCGRGFAPARRGCHISARAPTSPSPRLAPALGRGWRPAAVCAEIAMLVAGSRVRIRFARRARRARRPPERRNRVALCGRGGWCAGCTVLPGNAAAPSARIAARRVLYPC